MKYSGTNKKTDMSNDRGSIHEHNFRGTFNSEFSTQNPSGSLISSIVLITQVVYFSKIEGIFVQCLMNLSSDTSYIFL